MRYFIILAAIILIFGCGEKGGEKVAEKVMEKAIESNTGGKATVDMEENSLRIQTEEGEMTMTAGDSAKLPVDFPKDVFLYKGADINTAMELPEGFNLMFQTKDDPSIVSEAYLSEMEEEGWAKEMTMDMGGSKMMVFKKDERMVNVTITSDEEVTQIVLSVAKE